MDLEVRTVLSSSNKRAAWFTVHIAPASAGSGEGSDHLLSSSNIRQNYLYQSPNEQWIWLCMLSKFYIACFVYFDCVLCTILPEAVVFFVARTACLIYYFLVVTVLYEGNILQLDSQDWAFPKDPEKNWNSLQVHAFLWWWGQEYWNGNHLFSLQLPHFPAIIQM